MYTFLSSTFLQSSHIEYEVDLLPNMALKVLRKENSKKKYGFYRDAHCSRPRKVTENILYLNGIHF